MSTTPYVLRKDSDGIAELTLNRPDQYNALSFAMLEAILSELEDLDQNEQIKVVILGAAGKAFCPGHDLKEIRNNRNQSFNEQLFAKCTEMMLKIRNLRQPVIAKVQGVATAAGCQLVATCDLAIASERAKFATSGINYGIFCSTPAVAISRIMHPKKALEILLTGDFLTAEAAQREGLINYAVPDSDLQNTVWNMANKIAHKAPDALRIGKSMFYEQLNTNIEEAYALACVRIVNNILEPDAKEGLDAFAEKRKPDFSR